MITKDMAIGQVIARHPESVEIMLKHGLHCIGCSVSPYETLEGGALGHGMTEEQVESMVMELNEKTGGKEEMHGSGRSMKSDISGNAGNGQLISLTPKAAETVRKIMRQEGREGAALRVLLVPGGCAGFSYGMEFGEGRGENDTELVSNGITILVSKEFEGELKGTVIDFRESLQGAGFVMDNPNVKSACGCGKSFGV